MRQGLQGGNTTPEVWEKKQTSAVERFSEDMTSCWGHDRTSETKEDNECMRKLSGGKQQNQKLDKNAKHFPKKTSDLHNSKMVLEYGIVD